MERHLLLTVGEDQSALHAARFVARFFSNHKDLRVTLFSSASQPAAVWSEEMSYAAKQQTELAAAAALRKSRTAVERAKAMLVERGFPEQAIDDKISGRRFSKVLDIIQEAEAGLYDAVVLGRRGLSRLEEALDQSVTHELLAERLNFPIWVCRLPEVERQGVLVCVDGSEACLKAVDHVGFMLAQEPRHEVVLLHVAEPGQTLAETHLQRCLATLQENGLSLDRVRLDTVQGASPTQAILSQAAGYAAVALGRTGKGGSARLFGSVGEALLRQLAGAALWICR